MVTSTFCRAAFPQRGQKMPEPSCRSSTTYHAGSRSLDHAQHIDEMHLNIVDSRMICMPGQPMIPKQSAAVRHALQALETCSGGCLTLRATQPVSCRCSLPLLSAIKEVILCGDSSLVQKPDGPARGSQHMQRSKGSDTRQHNSYG